MCGIIDVHQYDYKDPFLIDDSSHSWSEIGQSSGFFRIILLRGCYTYHILKNTMPRVPRYMLILPVIVLYQKGKAPAISGSVTQWPWVDFTVFEISASP